MCVYVRCPDKPCTASHWRDLGDAWASDLLLPAIVKLTQAACELVNPFACGFNLLLLLLLLKKRLSGSEAVQICAAICSTKEEMGLNTSNIHCRKTN